MSDSHTNLKKLLNAVAKLLEAGIKPPNPKTSTSAEKVVQSFFSEFDQLLRDVKSSKSQEEKPAQTEPLVQHHTVNITDSTKLVSKRVQNEFGIRSEYILTHKNRKFYFITQRAPDASTTYQVIEKVLVGDTWQELSNKKSGTLAGLTLERLAESTEGSLKEHILQILEALEKQSAHYKKENTYSVKTEAPVTAPQNESHTVSVSTEASDNVATNETSSTESITVLPMDFTKEQAVLAALEGRDIIEVQDEGVTIARYDWKTQPTLSEFKAFLDQASDAVAKHVAAKEAADSLAVVTIPNESLAHFGPSIINLYLRNAPDVLDIQGQYTLRVPVTNLSKEVNETLFVQALMAEALPGYFSKAVNSVERIEDAALYYSKLNLDVADDGVVWPSMHISGRTQDDAIHRHYHLGTCIYKGGNRLTDKSLSRDAEEFMLPGNNLPDIPLATQFDNRIQFLVFSHAVEIKEDDINNSGQPETIILVKIGSVVYIIKPAR